jgi:hypothetical protein
MAKASDSVVSLAAYRKPQPQPPDGTQDSHTLDRARLIRELAVSWGVDLRLVMAIAANEGAGR